MAVGNEQRLLLHFTLSFLDQRRVGNAPELTHIAVIHLEFDQWSQAFEGYGEHAIDGLLRVSVERENRAQLGMTRADQLKTVFSGSIESFFMRPDGAVDRILQLGKSEKTAAQFFLAALEFKTVRQEIDRRSLVALENAIALPFIEQCRDRGVRVGLLAQIQPDKIIRRLFI